MKLHGFGNRVSLVSNQKLGASGNRYCINTNSETKQEEDNKPY